MTIPTKNLHKTKKINDQRIGFNYSLVWKRRNEITQFAGRPAMWKKVKDGDLTDQRSKVREVEKRETGKYSEQIRFFQFSSLWFSERGCIGEIKHEPVIWWHMFDNLCWLLEPSLAFRPGSIGSISIIPNNHTWHNFPRAISFFFPKLTRAFHFPSLTSS